MTALLVEGQLHVPHAPLGGQQRQLVETLEFQVLEEDQFLTADCKDDISCYFALAEAEALAVEDDLLLDAHLSEPVDHRHEGGEPEAFLLRTEFVAQLGDVLIAVYSLYFVVFHQASQKEAGLYVFHVLAVDYFFAHFGGEVAQVPTLEVAQDHIQH